MTAESSGKKCEGTCACGSERRTCGECGGDKGCACHQKHHKHVAIAIDGPAGAGKTTLAKALADKLGYVYVDTGALYRAFAVHKLWLEKEEGHEVTSETALHTFDLVFERDENGVQRVGLWGRVLNEELRTSEVSMVASKVSAEPVVRDALLELQRRQALAYDVVMEGRDIGTVVLPDAQVKIFLTADVNARAARRYQDLIKAGEQPDYCGVVDALMTRDWQDTTRATAPLRQACDAVKLDNTKLTFAQTVETTVELVERRLREHAT